MPHDYLITSAGHVDSWVYLVIVLVVALECQAGVGLLMPGETLVLATGFLAHQGLLDRGVLLVAISGAAMFGDGIGYALGWNLGRGWLLKQAGRFGLRREHLDRVDGFLLRHGGKAVFGSHFLHLFRPLIPFVAGARRMSYWKFFFCNAAGCIAWASVYLSLGWFAGMGWRVTSTAFDGAGGLVAGVLLLFIALGLLRRRLGRRVAAVRLRRLGRGGRPSADGRQPELPR